VAAALREGKEGTGIQLDFNRLEPVSEINEIKRSYSLEVGQNNERTTVYLYFLEEGELEAIGERYNLNESDELWLMPIAAFEDLIAEYPQNFSRSLKFIVEDEAGQSILKKIKERVQTVFGARLTKEDFKKTNWTRILTPKGILLGLGALAAVVVLYLVMRALFFERASDTSQKGTPDKIQPETRAVHPSELVLKKDGGFGAPHIQDLIAKELSKRFRDDIPADQQIKVESLDTPDGKKIRILLDSHGSRKSVEVLKKILREFIDQEINPSEWLFMIEALEKTREEDFNGSGGEVTTLAINIADQMRIRTVNPIRNMSRWDVVEDVIKQAKREDPDISRSDVLGYLIYSAATTKANASSTALHVPKTIEKTFQSWKGKASIEELYRAFLSFIEKESSAEFPDLDKKIVSVFAEVEKKKRWRSLRCF